MDGPLFVISGIVDRVLLFVIWLRWHGPTAFETTASY